MRDMPSSAIVNTIITARDYDYAMPRKRDRHDALYETGLRLRCAREAVGLSQVAAAKSVNVGQNTWNQWEAGSRAMNPYAVSRFCSMYGLHMDWIFRASLVGVSSQMQKKLLTRWQEYSKLGHSA